MKSLPNHEGYDAVVIGAGIVGSMIARELSRYEGRFALLEEESFSGFGVTKANPCMLHSPLMFPSGPLRIQLSHNASLRYKKLAKELDVDFREVDEIFVALDRAQLEKLETAKNWAEENRVSAGHGMITPDKLHGIEPHVTPNAIGALYGKGLSGAIYATEWTFALTENAAQNGFHLYYDAPVTEIRKDDVGLFQLCTPRGELKSRYIINAAGLFAEDIAHMVGDRDINLILTKGTMAILDKSSSHLLRNMVYGTYDREHSQLITPTAHGNLLMGLGYFTTPENKRDTSVNPGKLQEVIELCRALIPALSGSEVITSFAGIRSENTKAEGGDFYIAQSEHSPGVVHAVIGSPGLTAAPAIAEHVIKLLSQTGMEMVEKKHFNGQRKGWPRFESASLVERESIITSNKKSGHIVCRCEQVSKAEIQEAIQRGANCMDAIKHLTRAGMGRCQGGFCGNSVLNQLTKAMGVPPGQITKKGKNSFHIMQKGD
ncbi:NAD(P)/FAD-dependent oxidoreductase [Thermodesulfobacteriota bacterium]